jgi:hypothetical protein
VAKTGVCSECGTSLSNPAAKTCGANCRNKRSRRLRRSKEATGRAMGEANAHPPHLAHLAHVDDKLVHEVAKEELRPIVREAITEDVLRAAGDLVALTPVMVQAITEDLHSSDKVLRQKAYSLLAKYTLGNTSIAPQADASHQPMQVVFNLPRPGDGQNPSADATVVESDELRQCMECHADKPVEQFVGASERCQQCHDELREKVLSEFA